MPLLRFNSKIISYDKHGRGTCLMLLHGYLESKEVWDEFKTRFSDYTVITPDLPGHGDSEIMDENQTMEQMAEALKAILDHENISKCFVYGHSMGGYVAEAFVRQWPDMVDGIGLVHSTIYADTEEKKNNRTREIELIRNGKKAMVVSGMLPNIVAPQNVERLRPVIEEIIERAKMFAAKGIIAVLKAMMQRPAHQVNVNVPFHLIAGDKDSFIPNKVYVKMKEEQPHIHMDLIKGSGHSSFIEFPDETATVIKDFLRSIN
jgi:pimeloyl-ACP methyl ester carboxylesterase